MPVIPAIWTSVTTTSTGSVRRCSSACCAELTESTSKPRLRKLSRSKTAVSSSSSTIRIEPFTVMSYLSAANESRTGSRSNGRPATDDEADDRHDERNDKDDLCDARRTRGETEEAEDPCDQRDDKKGDCPCEHD